MKNSWRQLEAWGTELKNNPFTLARVRTTAFGVLLVLLTLLADKILQLNQAGILVYVLVLLVVGIISYIISSRTLSTIQHILRAQKRFIADASHELRTPLAIIKTSSEITLLSGDHIDPKEAKENLHSTVEEVDRMSKIIESLLVLSYYESQAGEIKLEKIDVSKLVVKTMDKIKNIAKKKSIDLRILNTDSCFMLGSPVAIEQIVMNLVKNSIAYTPPRGWVRISVTARNSIIRKLNLIELEVKDNGIGIGQEDLANVFNPFYKADRVRDPLEQESSGLGLTIVKKIVERHNGSISINSALGKGTTITITFPSYQPA